MQPPLRRIVMGSKLRMKPCVFVFVNVFVIVFSSSSECQYVQSNLDLLTYLKAASADKVTLGALDPILLLVEANEARLATGAQNDGCLRSRQGPMVRIEGSRTTIISSSSSGA